MRILIVEPEQKGAKQLRDAILNYYPEVQVAIAQSCKQALQIYYDFQPAIILCAVDGKGFDGLDVLQKFKEEPHAPKVIMIGDAGNDLVPINVFRAGAADYLRRPIQDDELQSLLDRHFHKAAVTAESIESPDAERTILVVDDDLKVCRAIKRILLEDGHNVLVAGSAETALLMMERQSVAIVISDWKMPEMNGIVFLKTIGIRFPHTITIMMTAHPVLEGPIEAINQAGVYQFVIKPWDHRHMRQTIVRLLAFRKHILQAAYMRRRIKRCDAALTIED